MFLVLSLFAPNQPMFGLAAVSCSRSSRSLVFFYMRNSLKVPLWVICCPTFEFHFPWNQSFIPPRGKWRWPSKKYRISVPLQHWHRCRQYCRLPIFRLLISSFVTAVLQNAPISISVWYWTSSEFPRSPCSCRLPKSPYNSAQDEWLLSLTKTWTFSMSTHLS